MLVFKQLFKFFAALFHCGNPTILLVELWVKDYSNKKCFENDNLKKIWFEK
jgi:hypothetical protein